MKLTPFIRSALYAETGAYTDRDAYISDLALSSIWGDSEDAEVPAERIALLGGIWDANREIRTDADRLCAVFQRSAAYRAALVPRRPRLPAVCDRDGGGDSGCKRTITKTKPVE